MPPANSPKPRISVSVMKGSADRAVAGVELTARTGSKQSETQVAWAKKATRKLGGEVRILSKRESLPSSAVIRLKRNDPT